MFCKVDDKKADSGEGVVVCVFGKQDDDKKADSGEGVVVCFVRLMMMIR